MSNLLVITNRPQSKVIESARSVMITPVVCEFGMERLPRFITNQLRPQEYVMWVDSDSIFLQPEEEILSRLQAYGNPMLLGQGQHGFLGPMGEVLTSIHTAISNGGWTEAFMHKMLPEVQRDWAHRIFGVSSVADCCVQYMKGK
jgi:hypothetical protein